MHIKTMASVNVLVRARPLNQRELALGVKVILKMERRKTYLNYVKAEDESDDSSKSRSSFTQKQFLFDRSYWSVNENDAFFADQHHIFNEYGSLIVQSALDGYNACVFAYGQTGSGKTYTMIGTNDNLGLIPRICQSLFKKLKKIRDSNVNFSFRVEVSYMEIYNENVRDLLRSKSKADVTKVPSLKVREHPKEGPFVQDLTSHPVTDYNSIEILLEDGNNVRVTATTNMNSVSSRSHAIFTIKVTQTTFSENNPSETISKLSLVDLAGSERVALSGATGVRLKEGGNINKSLVTLGLVISALADNSTMNNEKIKIRRRPAFVPYRDSVLTWLLKDSIGGNSKTIMIANVSPADIYYSETLSTLRYASRARKIVNKPVINEDPNVRIIRELRAEIERLKKSIANDIEDVSKNLRTEDNQDMQAQLKLNQQKAEKLTKNWLERNKEAQKIFEEKCLSLSYHGHQTVLTSSKPHLVGLEVDPLSTDIVIYHLEIGKTVIGSKDLSEEQGIALEGSGIESEHCFLDVQPDTVTLIPIASLICVNDKLVETSLELRQGDVIQFGHYWKFRFNNPCEAAVLREKRRSGFFSSMEDRVSPAVMKHYRSLDSGLSSPDDLDAYNTSPIQVMNSTAISSTSSERKSLTFSSHLQNNRLSTGSDIELSTEKRNSFSADSDQNKLDKQDYRLSTHSDDGLYRKRHAISTDSIDNNRSDNLYETHLTDPEQYHVVYKTIKAASMVTCKNFPNESTSTDQQHISDNDALIKQRKIKLKSASTSNIITNSRKQNSFTNLVPQMRVDLANEIFLSTPELNTYSTARHLDVTSTRNTSLSDLSLSTEDLACNLLLQSQLEVSSPAGSKQNEHVQTPTSLPNCLRSRSLLDISPQRKSFNEIGVFRSESLFDVSRDRVSSLNSNERQSNGSILAFEMKQAADDLHDKREKLKLLIAKYRTAEIERVEVENENLKRASENEAIFRNQQLHLESLFKQQKTQLEQAGIELEDYKTEAIKQKEEERKEVEFQLDCLMELKRKYLTLVNGSEVELRKKKFKLNCKIEEYWKRMDLYDNLLVELELDKNRVQRENEGKVVERMKLFDLQQAGELQSLREQLKISEDLAETLLTRTDEEKNSKVQLVQNLQETKLGFSKRIEHSENLHKQLQQERDNIENTKTNELETFEKQIATEEEKHFKFTIYKMHECSTDPCTDEHVPGDLQEAKDCKISGEEQRQYVNELKKMKNEKQAMYNERLNKCDEMVEDAQYSLVQLRAAAILEVDKLNRDIAAKDDIIEDLELQYIDEIKNSTDLSNELSARERPRSYMAETPEETEEDIIALEQQKEQIIQSKNKIQKILEDSLRDEFSSLETPKKPTQSDTLLRGSDQSTVSSIDHALKLIFHSGRTAGYTKCVVSKHLQYEQRKRCLLNVKDDLANLMRHQATVHQDVATNFLSQKSVFEDMRSKERQDIHDTIQTLIGVEDSPAEKKMWKNVFNVESKHIVEYQEKLQKLENEMYLKVEENQRIQSQLDKLQEKMANDFLNLPYTGPTSLDKTFEKELQALTNEKRQCEFLIEELRRHLEKERQEYLEMLKSKDEYDVIGQEYRDARHTFFQTEGNQAASEVLREIFYASNVLEKSSGHSNEYHGGWKYVGSENNVKILRKFYVKKCTICVLGQGVIKASPKSVWEAVRNPSTRMIYDKMVKKMNVVEHCSDTLKVVYIRHETRVMLLKQSRDCCCIHAERVEGNKYVAAFKSVDHPDCPEKKGCRRSEILPSGWIVEPYTEGGEDWSLIWYLLKIDFTGGLPNYFMNNLIHKIPLSIDLLRKYLVLS